MLDRSRHQRPVPVVLVLLMGLVPGNRQARRTLGDQIPLAYLSPLRSAGGISCWTAGHVRGIVSSPVDSHPRWLTCPCGKRALESRKAAKLAARQMGGNGTNGGRKIRAYQCDSNPDSWHLTSERTDHRTWYRQRDQEGYAFFDQAGS